MKHRFWFPAIENDHNARMAAVWSCFGYVWIGGGQMLLALLNAAGWAKIAVSPEAGVLVCAYAVVFGWLTWKQSFAGTIVGFGIWALVTAISVGGSIAQGDVGTPLRGWWAIIGQAMLLLNGVRAAHYRRNVRRSASSSPFITSTSEVPDVAGPGVKAIASSEPPAGSRTAGVKYCGNCATRVLPLEGGTCPACGAALR